VRAKKGRLITHSKMESEQSEDNDDNGLFFPPSPSSSPSSSPPLRNASTGLEDGAVGCGKYFTSGYDELGPFSHSLHFNTRIYCCAGVS